MNNESMLILTEIILFSLGRIGLWFELIAISVKYWQPVEVPQLLDMPYTVIDACQ